MADLWFPHSDTIPAAQQWQQDAWDFFGNPDDQGGDQIVGEIGYVFRWMAAQLGRLSWRVEVNGEQLDADSERAAAIVERVTSPTVSAAIGLNLLVAGQCSYVAMDPGKVPESIPPTVLAGTGDTRWMVISVVDPHRAIVLRGNELKIEGLRPHPANPRRPDSPARSALPILGEIRQLQDLSHAQNNSRIANTSILMVANELGLGPADDMGGSLSDRLKQVIDAPLREPRRSGASPIVLTGPAETIANSFRLPVAWATSNQPYDNRIDQRINAAIQRLAWTIPLPPEALLGMATTARATAFQIEDCLAPETRVLTADLRWVEVGDVKAGDELAGFDETTTGRQHRKWRTATVETAGRADRPCFAVTLGDGTRIVASAGHQWLLRDSRRHPKWVTTEWLHDALARPRIHQPTVLKVIDTWEPDDSWEAGYLAGVFDGEGHLMAHRTQGGFTVGFGQRNNVCLHSTETFATALGFDLRRYGPASNSVNGACHQCVLRGGQAEVLRFLGQVRPPRLYEKYVASGGPDHVGDFRSRPVTVVSVEPVGEQEVVTLGTSTRTVVAEGFAHHNSTYRSHLEPEAELLASIYSAAANAVTPDGQEVRLIPDPTDLLARRHSVQDAFDAWDRGLAAAAWVRDVLGIPDDAEATDEDLALLMAMRGTGDESTRDPSDAAANEAVSAAPAGMVDLDAMADELARIDDELRAELRGAVEVAARRAREKVGARARSLAERDLMAMSSIAEVDNERVAAVLGADTLTTLGVNVSETVESAVGGLVEWWRGVLSTARESIVAVAGDIDADWDTAADESVALLTERMTAWVTDTIADELGAVPDDIVRDVVAAAGGVADG